MDIYLLMRNFWDFSFENPEKITPTHCAIYFFAINQNNRLGWKEKFGFPSYHCMEAIGIKSRNTFYSAFDDLVEFGFIKIITKSKNQNSATIISLAQNLSRQKDSTRTALDLATIRHEDSTDTIDIPRNKETKKQREEGEAEKTENQVEDFSPPVFSEIEYGRILSKLPEKKVEEKKGNIPPKFSPKMAVLLPQDEMLLDMFVSEYSEAKKIPPAKIPFIQSAFLKLSDAEKKELADFLGENFFQKYLEEKGEFAKNAESFLEMKFWRELTPKKQKKVATQTIEKMMEDYQNGIL